MNEAPTHDCPLCGSRFDDGAPRCGGCPLSRGCSALCCPNCGYEFVDRSATIEAITRIGHRLHALITGAEGRGAQR